MNKIVIQFLVAQYLTVNVMNQQRLAHCGLLIGVLPHIVAC